MYSDLHTDLGRRWDLRKLVTWTLTLSPEEHAWNISGNLQKTSIVNLFNRQYLTLARRLLPLSSRCALYDYSRSPRPSLRSLPRHLSASRSAMRISTACAHNRRWTRGKMSLLANTSVSLLLYLDRACLPCNMVAAGGVRCDAQWFVRCLATFLADTSHR
jgi:hypothetical protein